MERPEPHGRRRDRQAEDARARRGDWGLAKGKRVSTKALWSTAYHEAGHAVAGIVQGLGCGPVGS